MSQNALDKILGYVPDPPPALVDNWQTAFIWLSMGIVVFALVALFFGIKRGIQGKHVNKGMLPYVKWPLLFASAGFNVFFTYYVFLPAGNTVAAFSAVVMGGVNLAEAYLVRLIIATWRHDLKVVFRLALLFTLPVFMYSLMAAGSSFSTMMNKNGDVQAASMLELQAAQDRIKHSNAQVAQAQIGAQNGDMLNRLYQTQVINSKGVQVSFGKVKQSCFSSGFYAQRYPDMCNQYRNLSNGTYTAASVADANTEALATSASEKLRMAKIIKDRPPEISPTLLGFALGSAFVGFIVSLALESAIIGVGFFEELFIKPTPLPGLVKFNNKALDWNADTITQRGLQVDVSPSPGTVNFSDGNTLSNPFVESDDEQAKSVQGTPDTGTVKGEGTVGGKSVQGTLGTGTLNRTGTANEKGQKTKQVGGRTVMRKQYYDLIYGEVKQLVTEGQIKPTVRPVTDAVTTIIKHKGHTLNLKPSELTKPQRQQIAQVALEHLEQEQIVERNQEGGVGKPKYVLAEKHVKAIKENRKIEIAA